MDRNFYYIGIAFFGMVNGLFNQALVPFAYLFAKVLAPALLFGSESLTLLFASLMASTATIIVGGIPAAIYEHVIGAKEFDRHFALDMAGRNRAADAVGGRKFFGDRPLAPNVFAISGVMIRVTSRRGGARRCHGRNAAYCIRNRWPGPAVSARSAFSASW